MGDSAQDGADRIAAVFQLLGQAAQIASTMVETVAAAAVPFAGRSADGAELRERLRAELSAFKVPRHIFIYESSHLPFTDTGKIDKRKLTELLAGKLAES